MVLRSRHEAEPLPPPAACTGYGLEHPDSVTEITVLEIRPVTPGTGSTKNATARAAGSGGARSQRCAERVCGSSWTCGFRGRSASDQRSQTITARVVNSATTSKRRRSRALAIRAVPLPGFHAGWSSTAHAVRACTVHKGLTACWLRHTADGASREGCVCDRDRIATSGVAILIRGHAIQRFPSASPPGCPGWWPGVEISCRICTGRGGLGSSPVGAEGCFSGFPGPCRHRRPGSSPGRGRRGSRPPGGRSGAARTSPSPHGGGPRRPSP